MRGPSGVQSQGSRSEFYMERRDSAAAAQYGLNTHDAGLYPDMFNHSWGYVCTSWKDYVILSQFSANSLILRILLKID
jgi:hypothetical protein